MQSNSLSPSPSIHLQLEVVANACMVVRAAVSRETCAKVGVALGSVERGVALPLDHVLQREGVWEMFQQVQKQGAAIEIPCMAN